MTGLQRKIALMEKGVTLTAIANDLELTVSHVSNVMRGFRRSPRVEEAIAKAIGKPVSRVFPDEAA